MLTLFAFGFSHIAFNEPTPDNSLSKAEKAQGWQLLFDGHSLNNWRIYLNKPADCWAVENGTIHCLKREPGKNEKRGDLITINEYENFDLVVDWKLAPQGNSGILYMVTEQYPQPYLSGPEYQLIDDNHYAEKLEDWQHTGANYAMNPPTTLAAKPIGEWNHTRIVVNNGHVEHWLNGVKVVDYRLWTNEWNQNKDNGKWKEAPGYGMSKKGHIDLQDHAGSEAWFKNIKIKTL